jgi:hypothetical protein
MRNAALLLHFRHTVVGGLYKHAPIILVYTIKEN